MILDVSKEDDYTIATALRGPDFETPGLSEVVLKEITTEVLRYFTGVGNQIVYITPLNARRSWNIRSKQDQKAVIELSQAYTHFMRHFYDALVVVEARIPSDQLEEFREYKIWIFDTLNPRHLIILDTHLILLEDYK
jgi:hypothetical protein